MLSVVAQGIIYLSIELDYICNTYMGIGLPFSAPYISLVIL